MTDVDPIIVERPIVCHVTDQFIDNMDEHLSHASRTSTMLSFSRGFNVTDAMFLEFVEDLDNLAGGLSLVGDNSDESNNVGTSQPFEIPTPRRRVQSRLLELEYYVIANGRILMTIALDTKTPISPHAVHFNLMIDFFVLDFNDQAMNRFAEHQMLNTFQKFQNDCHKYFKKYSDLEEAHANPPHLLVRRDED
ncbi:CACTA en-spm transposon protein [Cucumis melo var. makuwa]|uniref:CACTA en-spm transposon protein n=1 Tax=Cucumis melo var. makuwa TaxID=1194695 RepID=A0A5A7UZ80_CUCMM|nr:CACTA en-spm transposon protein [Cucumis melo var. makuwa]TYK00791.1 CACTA en-spm transposon protein [Cucumis melo var. makuwa]